MNIAKPVTLVNLYKITNKIRRIMTQAVVDTVFRIKQASKVFSQIQIKRFDEEKKGTNSGG